MHTCSTKRFSGSGASGAAALVEATISGSAGAAAVRAARLHFSIVRNGVSEPLSSLCRDPSPKKTSSPPQLSGTDKVAVFRLFLAFFACVRGHPNLPAWEGRKGSDGGQGGRAKQ